MLGGGTQRAGVAVRRSGLLADRVARASVLAAAALGLVLATPAPAGSSSLIARDASDVALRVDAQGRALITYASRSGARAHLLAWGAVDALQPSAGASQVDFKLDYSGGRAAFGRPLWKSFRNRCAPYDGPHLAWLVTACKAPDGSYWALQAWQKDLPFHGKPPSRPFHRSWELRLSHWMGDPAKLEVWQDWKYSARFESVFGRYTYRGAPVYGFRPVDEFVRRAYIDTFNSGYGPGWRRADALATHRPSGVFCAILADHLEDRFGINRGRGERYRITIPGPGVTPDVSWEGAALPAWDPGNAALVRHEQAMNELMRSLGDTDPRCTEP